MQTTSTLVNPAERAALETLKKKQEHIKEYKKQFLEKAYRDSEGYGACVVLRKLMVFAFFIVFAVWAFLVTQEKIALSEGGNVELSIFCTFVVGFVIIMACEVWVDAGIQDKFRLTHPDKAKLLAMNLDF